MKKYLRQWSEWVGWILLLTSAVFFLDNGTVSPKITHAQNDLADLCIRDFEDLNGNLSPDTDEPGLADLQVFLSQNSQVVASLTTTPDEDCFRGLALGEYEVRFEVTSVYSAVTPTILFLTHDGSSPVNFGAVRRSNPVTGGGQQPDNRICIFVFHDENTNGERESTEALMGNIDINLLVDELIVQTLITRNDDATCFENLGTQTYQVLIPPSPNHIMISRRDIAINFRDFGNEVTARFAARPVNPLSDEATISGTESGDLIFDSPTRFTLAIIGTILVVLFMAGLGTMLYGLIRR